MSQNQRDLVKKLLDNIEAEFKKIRDQLIAKFTNTGIQTLNYSAIRELVYNFTQSKPTISQKVQINRFVRQNIQFFIKQYVSMKLNIYAKNRKKQGTVNTDNQLLVETLNIVWNHYQIFIFCHYFITQGLSELFQTINRMSNAKDHQYRCQLSTNAGKEEVVAVAVMGVNQLKKYFQRIGIIQTFKDAFSKFFNMERQDKKIPRQELRQSVHSLESCYFDMEAHCMLEPSTKKPKIAKIIINNDKLPNFRRSRDGQFFNDHLLKRTLQDLKEYYKKQVRTNLLNMNAIDEIKKVLNFIAAQEERAEYYIHSKENRGVYIDTLNEHLIIKEMPQRIAKADGWPTLLEKYQQGKEDYANDIKSFWKVYSRVFNKSKGFIRQNFSKYLQSQAQKVTLLMRKPPDFINELMRINGKCVRIMEFCGNNFELQNERNNMIKGMLSNDITQSGRKEKKYNVGARNLAIFIDIKFKAAYPKPQSMTDDVYKQLVTLFKILQQKDTFTQQHHRYMANRLIENVDFSKDLDAQRVLLMQDNFVKEIGNECGTKQVQGIADNIKDIKKSRQMFANIKVKIGEDNLFPLSQLIIKNGVFWPERSTYKIQAPPKILKGSFDKVTQYFKKKDDKKLQFELNAGVSLFKGEFANKKKQNFQFKNLYMIVLLLIDQQGKLTWKQIKMAIEASGNQKEKPKAEIELAKAVFEMTVAGLIICSNKQPFKAGTQSFCKLSDTDQLSINANYDFLEQQKRKKAGKGPPPKPIAILKNNILSLPQQLKRGFDQLMKGLAAGDPQADLRRWTNIVDGVVKSLKHAHHNNMSIQFTSILKQVQDGKYKQFKVNQKFLKQIIDYLINQKICQRDEKKRNVFNYIA